MKQVLFFISLLSIFPSLAVKAQTIGEAGQQKEQVTIIEPTKRVPEIKSAAIDDEHFELGFYGGLISLQDFNTVSVIGLNANYYLGDSWLIGAQYGKSGAPEATFEDAVGAEFVRDRDDGFRYIALMGGYELFEGRSFFANNQKFSTYIFADFGVESVKFNGENQTGFVLGASYKITLNDWLSGDLRMRDHIVKRTFLNEERLTQNIEFTLGLNVFF